MAKPRQGSKCHVPKPLAMGEAVSVAGSSVNWAWSRPGPRRPGLFGIALAIGLAVLTYPLFWLVRTLRGRAGADGSTPYRSTGSAPRRKSESPAVTNHWLRSKAGRSGWSPW